MVDSQLIEEEVREAEVRDARTKTQKGPTEPIFHAQTTPSPSPAFVKENIDVLRKMIKELDHQAKANATPRKLVYVDSKKEAPDSKTHSTGKGQKGLPKDKEPSRLRR
uniref:Reverse transcriptase domain-containing protein n=1 Tax=Tanacetum cinerariifolium TaxID=118510 RepID=A0A6L2NDU9_TANCI|nr:reverse transcriptase domain-containing protein [Tanacetum cinerariifolium]